MGWASDSNGQVSNTPIGTGHQAIAGGGFHSLALAAPEIPEPASLGFLALGGLALLPRNRRRPSNQLTMITGKEMPMVYAARSP